jgi:hypothetical protein
LVLLVLVLSAKDLVQGRECWLVSLVRV